MVAHVLPCVSHSALCLTFCPPVCRSYKEKKDAELKAGAGNRSAWNTLFMRADTVAAAVAAHFGEGASPFGG